MPIRHPSRAFLSTRWTLRCSISRRLIAFILLFNLIALPSPAMFRELKTFASFAVSVSFGYSRTNSQALLSLFHSKPAAQLPDRLADRISRVSRIQVSPRRFVGYQGQPRLCLLILLARPFKAFASIGNLPTPTSFGLTIRAAHPYFNRAWSSSPVGPVTFAHRFLY